MDLCAEAVRIPSAQWRACEATSWSGSAVRRPARCRISRPSSASIGLAPTVPPISSCSTALPRRRSRRSRSSPRFERSTDSTGVGPWLHRIVVNRAIDWARARALRAEVGDGPLAAVTEDDRPSDAFSPPVVAALTELSPEHRAVIVHRHLLEYTPGEIAELLELPRGTVNSRLRRGLDDLADNLEREGR